MTGTPRHRIGAAAALAAALVFPVAADNPYLTSVAATGFALAIAVYGLNVLLGYAGQLSLAHAGFLGIGAYAAGILMKAGVSFWLALPAAVALTVAVGFLVGMVALRTHGDYFAIFTLAVGVIITTVIDRWESLTGGTDGLIGIPPPSPLGPVSFDSVTSQYYLALAALLAAMYVAASIQRSLLGRALAAIRNSESLAAAVGIDVGRRKRLAFAISTGFAGAAGALYAPILGYIGPSMSSFVMTFNLLLFLMLGGTASLAGPLIGTLAVLALTQALQAFEQYQTMVLGPVLVLIVIFFPHGIAGLFRRSGARRAAPRLPRPAPAQQSTRTTETVHAAPSGEAGD